MYYEHVSEWILNHISKNGIIKESYHNIFFTDIMCKEVIIDNKKQYQVTFKVYNTQPIDGIISASFADIGHEPQKYFTVKGNQTKEIGIIIGYPPRSLVLDSIISHNVPLVFEYNFRERVHDENAEIFEGERILDSPPSLEEPGEIIVDNEDIGFKICTQPEERFLMKILRKTITQNQEYREFRAKIPSHRWQSVIYSGFWGLQSTALYKTSGSGNAKVQWSAEIQENSEYDIYYYMPFGENEINDYRGSNINYRDNNYVNDLHLTIFHNEGVDDVIIDLQKTENDWIYIGTYSLSQGTAQVELTDKSNGEIVYADAVKWVKK